MGKKGKRRMTREQEIAMWAKINSNAKLLKDYKKYNRAGFDKNESMSRSLKENKKSVTKQFILENKYKENFAKYGVTSITVPKKRSVEMQAWIDEKTSKGRLIDPYVNRKTLFGSEKLYFPKNDNLGRHRDYSKPQVKVKTKARVKESDRKHVAIIPKRGVSKKYRFVNGKLVLPS